MEAEKAATTSLYRDKYIKPIDEYPLTLAGLEAFVEDKLLWHQAVAKEEEESGDKHSYSVMHYSHAAALDLVLCFLRNQTQSTIDPNVRYGSLERRKNEG